MASGAVEAVDRGERAGGAGRRGPGVAGVALHGLETICRFIFALA